jgi:hypothetical protein
MQELQRFQALSYEAQPVDLFQRLLPFSFTKSIGIGNFFSLGYPKAEEFYF